MDLILGDREIRSQIEAGLPIEEIERNWSASLAAYEENIRGVRLY